MRLFGEVPAVDREQHSGNVVYGVGHENKAASCAVLGGNRATEGVVRGHERGPLRRLRPPTPGLASR